MKRLLLLMSCLVALPPASRAADVRWITPVEIPSYGLGARNVWGLRYDWTGSYAGFNAGYTLGNTNVSFAGFPESSFQALIPPLPSSGRISTGGFTGGAQVGHNYQVGKFVLGIEADVSRVDNNASTGATGVVFGSPFTLTATQKLEWLATTRVRLGLTPVDRVLIYGTGGLAIGGVSTSTNLSFPTISYIGTDSGARVGWTAGAGAEYAFTNGFTARLEYLYYDLGGATAVGFPTPFNPPFQTQTHFDVTGHIVRLGLNYKVSWPGPWSAPAPGLVVKASPSARELQVEIGTRYWYSTAKTSKDLFIPDGSALISRLTYSDLTAHAAESFARVDHWSGWFVKGYLGAGAVTGGKLKDEDFPPFIAPYSATSSDQKDGAITYLSADVGYNFLRGPRYQLGAFIGYHYYREKLNAHGCAQTAGNPDICAPPISNSILVITNDAEWHTLRLGLNGSLLLSERLTLSVDAAWVPYTWLDSHDTHWLRVGSDLTGPIPENGKGYRVQLEGLLKYQVTPKFSLGVGGRYWRFDTKGASHFEGVALGGGPQPVNFRTDRYGAFVQGALKF